MKQQQDILQNFIFDNHPVRGEWVRLTHVYQKVMQQREYPPLLKQLLAEALVSVVLLYGISKQQGRLTLQFLGDGVLKMISVRCTHDYKIRGLLQWAGEVDSLESLAEALGKGQLVLTYEPAQQGDRYQSIVEVTGTSITSAMENYFMQSEQRSTKIYLAVDDQQAVGMMLQLLPSDSDEQALSWEHVTTLADTLRPAEMLESDNATLLQRLYHQEAVRIFEPVPLSFGCNFTLAKAENALLALGRQEAEEILADKASIDVTCEFCGRCVEFDRVDVDNLFKTGHSKPEDGVKH